MSSIKKVIYSSMFYQIYIFKFTLESFWKLFPYVCQTCDLFVAEWLKVNVDLAKQSEYFEKKKQWEVDKDSFPYK